MITEQIIHELTDEGREVRIRRDAKSVTAILMIGDVQVEEATGITATSALAALANKWNAA